MLGVAIVIEEVGHGQRDAAHGGVIVVVVGVQRVVGAFGVVVLLLGPAGGHQRLHTGIALRRGVRSEVGSQVVRPRIAVRLGSGGVRHQEIDTLGVILHVEISTGTCLEVALQGIGEHGVGQLSGGDNDETFVAHAEAVGQRRAISGILGACQSQLHLAGFCSANALGKEVLRCLHGISHGNNVHRLGHEHEHQ